MLFLRYKDDLIIEVQHKTAKTKTTKAKAMLKHTNNKQKNNNKEGPFLKEKMGGLELSVSNNMITPTTLTKTQFIGFELALSPNNKEALVCPIIRDCTINSVRLTAQISIPQSRPQ